MTSSNDRSYSDDNPAQGSEIKSDAADGSVRFIPPPFYRPAEAMEILESEGGVICGPALKELIADKIRDGKIRAYAGRAWDSRKRLASAWEAGPPNDSEERVQIDRGDFLLSESWKSDVHSWDWQKGNFHCGSEISGRRRMYKNVILAKDDVDKLRLELSGPKGRGGRVPESDYRDEVWLSILDLYICEGKTGFNNRAQALREITRRLGWDPNGRGSEKLGERSLKNILTKVRKKLELVSA